MHLILRVTVQFHLLDSPLGFCYLNFTNGASTEIFTKCHSSQMLTLSVRDIGVPKLRLVILGTNPCGHQYGNGNVQHPIVSSPVLSDNPGYAGQH